MISELLMTFFSIFCSFVSFEENEKKTFIQNEIFEKLCYIFVKKLYDYFNKNIKIFVFKIYYYILSCFLTDISHNK